MMDDRFEDVVRDAARDYNEPPETPRELMWARIEATRAERARRQQDFREVHGADGRAAVAVGDELRRDLRARKLSVL